MNYSPGGLVLENESRELTTNGYDTQQRWDFLVGDQVIFESHDELRVGEVTKVFPVFGIPGFKISAVDSRAYVIEPDEKSIYIVRYVDMIKYSDFKEAMEN